MSFTEEDHVFHAFHPADYGDNAEQRYIQEIMFFTAVDPGVRDLGTFGPYVHHSLPCLSLAAFFSFS
jgi:hypothetical protein